MTHPKSGMHEVLPEEKQNNELSLTQYVFSGSVTGAFEVLVDHPLWSIKTRLQQGSPFTLNPQILYKGILPNAASMVPITAIQVGLNHLFQKFFFGGHYQLSDSQRLLSAFAAGLGSAAISCPTEMVMTHQTNGFYSTSTQLFQQGGLSRLYTGMIATMLREGMFASFFLAVTPLLKNQIKHYYPHDYSASLLAGMTAGIGATIASQGFDVMKTVQQSHATASSHGFFKTAKTLYNNHGAAGFFKGITPRGLRVVSAVTLMGWMNEKITEILKNDKKDHEISHSTSTKP